MSMSNLLSLNPILCQDPFGNWVILTPEEATLIQWHLMDRSPAITGLSFFESTRYPNAELFHYDGGDLYVRFTNVSYWSFGYRLDDPTYGCQNIHKTFNSILEIAEKQGNI